MYYTKQIKKARHRSRQKEKSRSGKGDGDRGDWLPERNKHLATLAYHLDPQAVWIWKKTHYSAGLKH